MGDRAVAETGVRSYSNLIAGEWSDESRPRRERRSPSNGETVTTYAAATVEDIDRAVAIARAAFDSGLWSRVAPIERGRIMMRWADLIDEHNERLARIEAAEAGKPIRIARDDMKGTAELTRYAGTLAYNLHGDAFDGVNGTDIAMVLKEPVGVVAAIVPWNFPGLIYSQKVPFALAAGCTVVVKPAEMTPGTALELSALAYQAGVPGEALSVVTGSGSVIGQRLAEHPDVDLLSFTGSTEVSKAIAAAASSTHKHLAFELGGKGATVVFDDADLDDAVDGVLFGVFYNQGETCIAGTRLLVQDTVADEFVARVAERAAQLRVGDVQQEGTEIGAMISEGHLEKVLEYIDSGRDQGAEVVTGGNRLQVDGVEAGYFVAPTVLDRVASSMRVFQEEIFGPVLAITRFAGDDEAIELANATEYGLAHGVWTKNIDRAVRLGRELRAGTVWINTANDGAPNLPFGGVKASGNSREKGAEGLEEYLVTKTFHIHVGPRVPFYADVTGA